MHMNRLSVFLIFLLTVSAAFGSTTDNLGEKADISIIPQPVKLDRHDGYFTISSKTTIVVAAGSESEAIAIELAARIFKLTGFQLSVESLQDEMPANAIRLSIGLNDPPLGMEGYALRVTPKHITINAEAAPGLFYGVQTLYQLMPPEIYAGEESEAESEELQIPCLSIRDYPRYRYRGMHLDVSRHFFDIDFVKRYIDLIAMHKMNRFHWHLTDDNGWRIEIKAYPKLTEIAAWRVDREKEPWRMTTPIKPGEKATYGGYYTQEEIKEVVEYARKRYITIIPEIEMPGHTSEVLAAYPELSCTGGPFNVAPASYWPNVDIFCAGKEETFEFLTTVLDEVIELFPSKMIHIGGDEATKTRWQECELCQKRINDEGLDDEEELQGYFVKRIEKHLNSKGRTLVGWDEIVESGLPAKRCSYVLAWYLRWN
jgi:hexosaminidase